MIDITSFQIKLELLKEFISMKIDNNIPCICKEHKNYIIDTSCIPEMPIEDIITLYDQTGLMFWNQLRRDDGSSYRIMNFDDYIEYKNIVAC